jgi:peroxiredoxin Q/BCP
MSARKAAWLVLPLLLQPLGCKSQKEQSSAKTGEEVTTQKPAGLSPGDAAPDFSVAAHSGKMLKLSELRGRTVVLYFYPKDDTPGCTTEAQGFRDTYESYTNREAVVIGVSSQGNDSHKEFADEQGLPFYLLPDEDRALAKSYGVGTNIFGLTARVTFLIGPDGKIAKIYKDVTPDGHAQELLADIDALGLKAKPGP